MKKLLLSMLLFSPMLFANDREALNQEAFHAGDISEECYDPNLVNPEGVADGKTLTNDEVKTNRAPTTDADSGEDSGTSL